MRAGDVLDGRYRIEAPLAKGGMGAVYKATHLGTDRLVALKVINSELVSSAVMLERFRREAKAAGRLSHSHVVNVTDFGLCDLNGKQIAYLVMEFLHGRTLRDLLKERKKLDVDIAIEITEQVALAVDAAHKLGIVHRDLKPENIWLSPSGVDKFHAKVLDFGIAKLREELTVPPSQLPPQLQKSTFEDDVIVVGEVPRAVTMFQPESMPGARVDQITNVRGGGRQPMQVTPATRTQAGTNTLGLRSAAGDAADLGLRSTNTMSPSSHDARTETGQVSWKSVHLSSGSDPSGGARTPGSFSSTPASGQLTEVGGILGTPYYMAPEQFQGEAVDERADIYALGVVVYQMLTGDVPHRGNVGQLVIVHADKLPPPPMVGVPKPVEAIVMRALSHNPAARPSSARLVAAGLKGAAEGEDVVRRRAMALPSTEIVTTIGTSVVPWLVPLAALVLLAQTQTKLWYLAPAVVVVVAALSALATMVASAYLRTPSAPSSTTRTRSRAALKLVLARLPSLPRATVGVLFGNALVPAMLVHAPQTSSAKLSSLAQPVRGVLRALTLRTWACAVFVTCAIPFAALARALALDALYASVGQGTNPSPAMAAFVAVFGTLTALGPVLIAAYVQVPVALTAVELLDNARAIAGDEVVRPIHARVITKQRTLYGFLPAVVGVVAWLAVVSAGFEAAVLKSAGETTKVLLDLGANPNPSSTRQPLHDAAFAGKYRMVEVLLNGGADPNQLDQLQGPAGGSPPLLAAISSGSTDCVRVLLEHGANPNVAAKNGETALRAALLAPSSPLRLQIVRMLLERGADPHKLGPDGKAPVDLVAQIGDPVLAKLFAGR